MKNVKKYIPNLITSIRLIATFVLVYLGLTNQFITLIILGALIALTDWVDGFLARKWKVTSKLGAKLDMLADKTLAFGLLIILVIKNSLFLPILILEFMIALLNSYFYLKKGALGSLFIGRVKTWFLFITIIIGFIGFLNSHIPVFLFVYFTLFWQIITFLCYLYNGHFYRNPKEKEEEYQEFYHFLEPILKNSEMVRRKTYEHHIHESVYDHVLRVSFDCYRIGKNIHLDYKSLTTAAILHDFYEKPWQYNPEKKKFLEKHAFTHAKDAVKNAKKVFGTEVVTPKVEEIMTTHMFPVNKRVPRSKEAWILTLVDKADSIDFIMHPILLFKIFAGKKQEEEKDLKKIKEKIKKETKK